MTESSTSDWVVYADTSKRYQSSAMRPGRITAPAPQLAPDRWSHAASSGATVTLCGLSIDGLKDFSSWRFRAVNPYLRCRECNEVAGNPSP